MRQKKNGKEVPGRSMSADILVAEDDEDVRNLIEGKLESELGGKYDIVTTTNGEEVWEFLEKQTENPPEIVILDVMMPSLDGFSVLERIRDDENLNDVKVIILTSRSREEDISRALEAGADDFVAKPFSPKELVSNIRSML